MATNLENELYGYEINKELSRGDFGVSVYLVIDRKDNSKFV